MTVEEFERLVSDWIDTPEAPELASAVAGAIAAQPSLAEIRDEWTRLVAGLRSLPSHENPPPALRVAIRAALRQS